VTTPSVEALRAECEEVSKETSALSEGEFGLPTRCPDWNVKELLAHMYRDVDRLNTGLAEPPPEHADVDSVSYWRAYDPVTDAASTSARAKQIASRYVSGASLTVAWDEMWRRAIEAAAATDAERVIRTWEPALTLDEFVKTRVLEICVHRMDLDAAFGRKGWGTDQAISIVDDILVGLLGTEPPDELDWDVVDFIDAGTGRRPLTEDEQEILGAMADRFPLLG
jgi:uncharacterized protein (TIGR03083 family)